MTDQRDDVQNAGRALFSLALSIANGLVGLTAFAYLIGYRALSAYYKSAGAPWAVDLSSSSQILSEAAAPIAFVALSTFLCYVMATDKTVKTPKFYIAGMWVLGAGFACQSVGLAGEQFNFLSARASYAFAATGGSLVAIGVGFYVGDLLTNFSESKEGWTPQTLLSVYVIANLAAWYAPGVLGEARAGKDMDPELSTLPSVILRSLEEEWRLVSTVDSRALIAAPEKEGALRRFRLVDFAEVAEIRSWSKPESSGPPGAAKPNPLANDR